ncbi:MAG: BamA/TamA family outer membrane protein [Rhodospirillaceae bacterium]
MFLRPDSLRLVVALVALALPIGIDDRTAWAFDFFGLLGEDEEPPEPRTDALPYQMTVSSDEQVPEDDADLVRIIQDVSATWKLRLVPPANAETLIRRIDADLGPMLDTLWASGYYNAQLVATVAGVRVEAGTVPRQAMAAAEALRGNKVIPVTFSAKLGPLFHVRSISVTGPGGANLAEITEKQVVLKPGDAARAADIRAAAARVVDFYRIRSHPMAKNTAIDVMVDHVAAALDTTLVIDASPLAGLGAIAITGTRDVPPEVVRSFVYREIGEPYSPKILNETRKAVAQIPALGGVRVREAAELDAEGNLPLTIEVIERAPHLVGFDALYSSIDGPSLAGHWRDNNLFGGAEQLRLDAKIFSAPSLGKAGGSGLSNLEASDLGGRFSASFVKPALWAGRDDLLIDVSVDHERVGQQALDGYTSSDASFSAAIRHRWSERFSAQGGIKADRIGSTDVLGNLDATLVEAPLSVAYDTSDDLLNPTSGVRVKGSLAPIWSSTGSGATMVSSQVSTSGYYSLNADAAHVLAVRIGLGSIVGAGLADIPPNERFYAGGGASVRGYGYRTLSPTRNGRLTGGRSLIEGSVEARVRLTEAISLVPFLDFGDSFADSVPDFTNGTLGIGSGIGLRYLTPVGPLRLDVAKALISRPGVAGAALYIGIGQAF